MSSINANATVTLTVNGKQAEDMLNNLKSHAQQLEKAIEKAAAAGNKTQLMRLQRELKQTNRQMNQIQNATKGVEDVLARLDKATPKELSRVLSQLKKNLNGIERGTEAWALQCEQIKRVKLELQKVNEEMSNEDSFFDRMNQKLNDWQTAIAGMAAAVTGLVLAGRSAVSAYADMDQEMANVRKFTGFTTEQVEQLNEEFKKMDTRTAREDLNKLAEEAGRLGKTSMEDVLGFVKAADQINVALDDLGEGATLTLSKLTSIFGDEERLGTEKALLSVGSVINELSQNCTASAPYLANFAQRMAGVGAQAQMTIPQIMGFAAVLDSQGQAVEMSATALSKLVMDMFKEHDKVVNAVGLDAEKFNEALKRSTNDGLMMLLEKLHELGNIDVLAPVFKDMGENGARAAQVISALAGNLDMVKWEQEEAAKAFEEGISVTNEFNVQNTTVQAGLDKAKKGVTEMAVALGEELQPVMAHVISSTTLLLKFMLSCIMFFKNYATEIISLTSAFIAYKVAVNASNIALKAHYAWLVVTNVLSKAYRATVATLTTAQLLLQLGVAKVTGNLVKQRLIMAQLNKSSALVASGWGALLAAGVLLGTAIYKLYKRFTELSQSEKDLQDIRTHALSEISEEKTKIETLISVAKDNNKSLKERREAVDALNKIIPNYNAQLDETTGRYKENKKALDDYLTSLTHQYEIEGAKDKLKEIGKEKAELTIKRQEQQEQVERDERLAKNDVHISGREGRMMEGGEAYRRGQNRQALNDTDKALKELDKREKNLTKLYGADIAKEAATDTKPTATGGNGGNGGASVPTETEKPSNTKKEDPLEAEKKWKTEQEAYNRIDYATGISSYEEYTNRMQEIAMEYNEKVLANTKATAEQKLEAEAAYYEARKQLADNQNSQSAKEENEYYAELLATEKQRYVDGKVDQKTFEDALELMELEHLKRMTKVYKSGSKEQLAADKAYQDKLVENQKKRHKEAEDAEKKHQDKLKSLKGEYFGDNKSEKNENYKSDSSALDEVYSAEIKAAGDDADEKLRIEKAYQKAKVALAKKYGQEYNDTNRSFLQGMAEDTAEWLQSDMGQAVTKSFDTITSGMASIFSELSSLIQAELEIQTSAIENRYDTEISKAEGNNYKVKKLEKQKQKELAKEKNEANKKMFAMQVIQAVAQTATNALNAYGSAAQVPMIGYILAPIAAAMAIAAGAIQIAAIKKQQQASEAQGYAEGGFTPAGDKYKEVGVVHAGEWVASQELLASPVARPIIEALDFAQRNNTIGSLKSEDVSASLVPSAALASASRPAGVVVQQVASNPTLSANDGSLADYAETMRLLQQRLSEPFVTVNTVTGDTGIKKAQDEYELLMKNKSPKSKRNIL